MPCLPPVFPVILLGALGKLYHLRHAAHFRNVQIEVVVDHAPGAAARRRALGEELLTPTRLYPKLVLPLLDKVTVKGMVHITGGGFYDNIPRVLPEGCGVTVDASAWPMPAVFAKLQEWGQVDWAEMFRTFNMGIGFIMVVDPADEAAVKAHFEAIGEPLYRLGAIEAGERNVVMKGGVFGD